MQEPPRKFPAWGLPLQWKVGGTIPRLWEIDLIQLQKKIRKKILETMLILFLVCEKYGGTIIHFNPIKF